VSPVVSPILPPAVLVVLMMAVEAYAGRLRRESAPSKDGGSLFAIYLIMGGGYAVAFGLFNAHRVPGPRLEAGGVLVGMAVAIGGMALRLWAVRTLGQYFTYVVKVTPDQKVVDTGPYRLIRHPSYTGGLLTGIGIGLSMGYAATAAIIGVTSFLAYLVRLRVEERALADTIGEPYRAYMARTKRLVPFVW
jgi:protein-S-isoprenylcysteine O-methyltransferase Ste14